MVAMCPYLFKHLYCGKTFTQGQDRRILGQFYKLSTIIGILRLLSHTYLKYGSGVVIYVRRAFVRLTTGDEVKRLIKSLPNK